MDTLAVLAFVLFVRGVLNRYLRDIFYAAFPSFYQPQRRIGPEGPGEWQHFFQRRLDPFYDEGGSNTFLIVFKATIHAMATAAITQVAVFLVFLVFQRTYVLELAGSPNARAQIYHGIQDSWDDTLVLQYSKSRQEMYVSHQMDSAYIDLSPTEGRALETLARFRLDQSRVFPYNEPAWGVLDVKENYVEGRGRPLLKIISPGGRARLHLHEHVAVYMLERADQRVRVEYDKIVTGDPLGAFMDKFCITYENGVFGTTRAHKRGFVGNGYGMERPGDLVECSKWTIKNGVQQLLSEDMATTAHSAMVPLEFGQILAPFFSSVFAHESYQKFKSLLAYALLSSAAVKLSLFILDARHVSLSTCYYVVIFSLSPYAFLAACWPAFLSNDSRENPLNLLFCFVFSVYMYCIVIRYVYLVDKQTRDLCLFDYLLEPEPAVAPGAEAVAERGHPDEGDRAGVGETVAATGRGENQETVEDRRQETPPTSVSAEHEDETMPEPEKSEAAIKGINATLTRETDGERAGAVVAEATTEKAAAAIKGINAALTGETGVERAGVVVAEATTVSAPPEELLACPRAPVLHASQIGNLPEGTLVEKAYEDLKGRMDKLVAEYSAQTEALEMKVRNLTSELDASTSTSETTAGKVALLQALAGMPSPGGEQRQGVVDQDQLLKRLEEKTREYFQTLAECAEAEKVRKEADAALQAQRTAFENEQRLFREKVEAWEYRRMFQENTVRPTATVLPESPSTVLSQDDEVEVEQLRRKLKNLRAMAADLENAVSLDEQQEIMEAQKFLSPLALSTWSEEQVRERLEALRAEKVVLEVEEEEERFAQRAETDELQELYAKKLRLEQQLQAAQNGPEPSPESLPKTTPEISLPSPEVSTPLYPQVSPNERIDALLKTCMPGMRAFEATGADRKVSFREHMDRMRRYAQMRYIFEHCTDEELDALAETEKRDQKIPSDVLDAVWRAKGRTGPMVPPSSQEAETHHH